MKVVAVIPARMGSSRFPGKPIALLAGRPMIEHVFRRTALSACVASVHVATCDREIADATERFGGHVILTSSTHERASDRVAEAAATLDADVIVMVQGDEPMIRPDMIDLAVAPLRSDPGVQCVNLAAPIRTVEDFEDRNTIKVAMAANGDALYFSREPLPTRARLPFGRIPAFKQVCIIPFRKKFLETYTALSPTPLEEAESVDMLRALEHGYAIRMVRCDVDTHAVDTPADLAMVEIALAADPVSARYLEKR